MAKKTELIIVTAPVIKEHRFLGGLVEEHRFLTELVEEHPFLTELVEEHPFLGGLVEEHRFVGGVIEEHPLIAGISEDLSVTDQRALEHRFMGGSPGESSVNLAHPHHVSKVSIQRRPDGSLFLVLQE